MPHIRFLPQNILVSCQEKEKILRAALKGKIPIRYGCASCKCGTCGIRVTGEELEPMGKEEKELLEKMGLESSGSIRLACRARILSGEISVDLDFQHSYSPDEGED